MYILCITVMQTNYSKQCKTYFLTGVNEHIVKMIHQQNSDVKQQAKHIRSNE